MTDLATPVWPAVDRHGRPVDCRCGHPLIDRDGEPWCAVYGQHRPHMIAPTGDGWNRHAPFAQLVALVALADNPDDPRFTGMWERPAA